MILNLDEHDFFKCVFRLHYANTGFVLQQVHIASGVLGALVLLVAGWRV